MQLYSERMLLSTMGSTLLESFSLTRHETLFQRKLLRSCYEEHGRRTEDRTFELRILYAHEINNVGVQMVV